jgi:hypothetical protein
MKLMKHIFLICIILLTGTSLNNLFSQAVTAKPSRQSSLEAFSQGNYEKAFNEFRELLVMYPRDPLYKYYSGVCLVKLSKDPQQATNLLRDAVQSSGNIKTLPSDGLFYLGRAQQMSGNYGEAAESFQQYTEKVGKKTAREMGVPDFLQQCSQKKGQIAVTEVKPAEKPQETKPADKVVENIPVQKNQEVKPAAEPPQAAKPLPAAVPVVTGVKQNLPASYEKVLSEAVSYQYSADSVLAIVAAQKKEYDKISGNEKAALKVKIMGNEKTAAAFQGRADQKYREAEALNNKLDSAMLLGNAAKPAVVKPAADTTAKTISPAVKPVQKNTVPVKEAPPVTAKPAGSLSLFEVLSQPANDPRSKIAIDPEIPAGLVYRIQLAVFRNPVTPAFFKGLSPIQGFKIANTDKTIYYAGLFRKSADAGKALLVVKSKGFKDAFIVAQSGNKPVSPDRSAVMEKEWGDKPLGTLDKTPGEKQSDTIPPALTFRVEVTRTAKPLKEDVVEGMRKIAGERGLDIITTEDGKIDYLVGKFITFESAAEYSDLLKRNGYREAQVVAWLGKKEIPIETARQLVDKLK